MGGGGEYMLFVKQEAPKRQHEGRHAPLLLLHKQAHDKRGIAESLHAQITRARLTACEVGVFSREISQLEKIRPPPSFRSHGRIFERLRYCNWNSFFHRKVG